MNETNPPSELSSLEKWTATIGFILSGLVIGIVAVSYILNSPFEIKVLVWIIGVAFAGVAVLAIIWPWSFRSSPGKLPSGGLRTFLLLAIPIAFVLDSQICGLGLKACSTLCNVISFTMIGLGTLTAIQLYRDKSVGVLLGLMVVIGLIPHCQCGAPINTIFHSLFGGYSPTCQVIPLTSTLFAFSAIRGYRTIISAILVAVLLIVIVFIALGNPLFGFPWVGCVG